MKKIKIISIVSIAVILIGVLFAYFYVKTGKFTGDDWDENSTFSLDSVIDFTVKGENAKIIQISDLHFAAMFGKLNEKNYAMLDAVLEKEQPDLVVVTGDLNIALFNGPMLERFGKYMDEKKVYWAYSLGNHDYQFGYGAYNYIKKLSEFKYCLYKIGPTNLGTYLNYFIRVLNCNGEVISTLSILNNGNSYISDNLKKWYRFNIEGLNNAHGKKIENLMFVHIPFEKLHKYSSIANEKISIMKNDNDIVSVIEELDTTHNVFSGHDHLNNFSVKENNVSYHATPSFGFCGYGKTTVERGLRVIEIADEIKITLKGQSDYGF